MIESGVTVKEAQVLPRHKTAELTLNVYGRVRKERLSETIEHIGETLLPHGKCVTYVYQDRIGRGDDSATALENNDLRCATEMPKGGFEPPRPVRHHPLKMACLPDSTTSAKNDNDWKKPIQLSDVPGRCQCLSDVFHTKMSLLLLLPFFLTRCRCIFRCRCFSWCLSGAILRARRCLLGLVRCRSLLLDARWHLVGNRGALACAG